MSRPVPPDDWERWCSLSADKWDESSAKIGDTVVENKESGELVVRNGDEYSTYQPDLVRIKKRALEVREDNKIAVISIKP